MPKILSPSALEKRKKMQEAAALYAQWIDPEGGNASAVYQAIAKEIGKSVGTVITYLQKTGVITPQKPRTK